MINKKIIVLAIFLVSLMAVSAVTAADNSTDDIANADDNTDEIVTEDMDSSGEKEVLSSQENDELSNDVDEDVLGASPPHTAYSVSVSDTTIIYGSGGSISMRVTPASSSYSYRYNYYLKVYDSNNNEKISYRYYSTSGSSTVTKTYSVSSTQLNQGVYTIKILNNYDSKVMTTAKLTVVSVPYSAYSVSVTDTTINYGSGGSISMRVTPASSSYKYKYDYYLKVYDSNNNEKISYRYYSTSGSSTVTKTYSVSSNQFNIGVYYIKILNNYDNYVMSTAKLTVQSVPYSAYSVSVSDTTINYGSSGSISMRITPASSSYYYRYDYYLKVYDSNNNQKISQRYYSTSGSSTVTKTYTISSNQLNPGVYTIKIINNYDSKVMRTAKLTISKISIFSNDLYTDYMDTIEYSVRVADNDYYKSGLKVTFTCNGNTYQTTTDTNGYASLGIHLQAGTYQITTKCGSVVKYNTININPVYVANKYKDVYVKSLSGYYNGKNKISYGWKGNLEGYFKIYKGNRLVYNTKFNSNGNIGDYFNYVSHNQNYAGSAIEKTGTYKAVITNNNGRVLANAKIKIQKSPTHIKCKSFTTKIGARKSISVRVYDKSGAMKNVKGTVKVKIKGKTYKAKVRNGFAKIKNVNLPLKAKTLKCKVKFTGNKNFKASSSKFKIRLSKSNVVILKKNRILKVGKYTVKLSSKQYSALVKAFKKAKKKSITATTDKDYNVKRYYYTTAKKYKTTKAVKTWYAVSYMPMIQHMRSNGWTKVSEYTFTKANPQNKYGIGLSAYTYAVCKWVKTYPKLASKTYSYPVNAKIVTKKSSILPKVKIYSHGNTFGVKYVAIA